MKMSEVFGVVVCVYEKLIFDYFGTFKIKGDSVIKTTQSQTVVFFLAALPAA